MLTNRATIIGLAVSAVCLAAVVWWASRQEPPDLPSGGAELAALLGAIAVYALNTLVRAERWHALLRRSGAQPRRADTYALTVIGYTGNNVLPARAGDAVRVVLLAPRARASKRTVVGTLLAERLLDVAVVVALFVVVGYAVVGAVSRGDITLLASFTVAALLVVLLGFLVLRRRERVMALVRPMLQSTLMLRSRHGAAMLALTLVIWALEAVVWMLVGESVELDMNLLEGLYLVGLASVFALIPSGPAYAGTQDGAALIGVKAIGGSGQVAVSYLLVLRFVIVVPITLLGFLLLAARYGGISRLRAAQAEA